MAIQELRPQLEEQQASDDDWSLTTDQMIFMLQHHNAILAAYEQDDVAFFAALANNPDFKAQFGNMSFDEAYDRYEGMTEESHDGA